MENLLGTIFGRIQIIGLIDKNYFECKCLDCGKKLRIRKDGLQGSHGKPRIGGCRSCTRKSKKKDHTGEVYGDWKITSKGPDDRWGCSRWNTICLKCGAKRLKDFTNLRIGYKCLNCITLENRVKKQTREDIIKQKKQAKNLIGKIFGNYQVIKYKPKFYLEVLCLLCKKKASIRKDTIKSLSTRKCSSCEENKFFIDESLFDPTKTIKDSFTRLSREKKSDLLKSDLLGKKLDLLTVIGIHGKKYICKCDCGQINTYSKDQLRNKTSCGCGKKFRKLKYTNLVGKQYGFWKVIKKAHSKKDPRWLCECLKCGTLKEVNQYNLVSGCTKSCLKCAIKGIPKSQDYIEKHMLGENHHSWVKDRSKVIGTQAWFDKRVKGFYILQEEKKLKKNSFLYILEQKSILKIGKTKESAIKGRLRELERTFGKFTVNSLYKGSERFIYALEHNCHRKFKNFRLKREKNEKDWNGHTEWFRIDCLPSLQMYLGDFCG